MKCSRPPASHPCHLLPPCSRFSPPSAHVPPSSLAHLPTPSTIFFFSRCGLGLCSLGVHTWPVLGSTREALLEHTFWSKLPNPPQKVPPPGLAISDRPGIIFSPLPGHRCRSLSPCKLHPPYSFSLFITPPSPQYRLFLLLLSVLDVVVRIIPVIPASSPRHCIFG